VYAPEFQAASVTEPGVMRATLKLEAEVLGEQPVDSAMTAISQNIDPRQLLRPRRNKSRISIFSRKVMISTDLGHLSTICGKKSMDTNVFV
jgi:hypothetical protein